jgi:hypothetical protein
MARIGIPATFLKMKTTKKYFSNRFCAWIFIFCTVNDYPPSCWNKIPHFKGCEEASKRLARLSEFRRAQVDAVRVIGLAICFSF